MYEWGYNVAVDMMPRWINKMLKLDEVGLGYDGTLTRTEFFHEGVMCLVLKSESRVVLHDAWKFVMAHI